MLPLEIIAWLSGHAFEINDIGTHLVAIEGDGAKMVADCPFFKGQTPVKATMGGHIFATSEFQNEFKNNVVAARFDGHIMKWAGDALAKWGPTIYSILRGLYPTLPPIPGL